MKTAQEKFWQSAFGKGYIKRNFLSPAKLDKSYMDKYGITKTKMNKDFLGNLKLNNILEVGCNIGNQLASLKSLDIDQLYGLEINREAAILARKIVPEANIVEGSAFNIPFRDNYFDLVFTAGVLIHISPKDIKKALTEIYRVSKKYIWGFEYFAPKYQTIDYRGNKDRLWKSDFAKMYCQLFPDLKLVKESRYPYLKDNNVDSMFLLKKV